MSNTRPLRKYKFQFVDRATGKTIVWERMGTNAYSVHDLAVEAAKRDYPQSGAFSTFSPQDD
jgi:hypothetical protein